jgi:hypothetical protein
MAEDPHTDAYYVRVGTYNTTLWNHIKPNPLFLPDRPQPPPPPQDQTHVQAQDHVLEMQLSGMWFLKECISTVGMDTAITESDRIVPTSNTYTGDVS